MGKICKKCGSQLDEDSNYCIICDRFVDAIDETEAGMDKDDASPYAIYNKTAQLVKEDQKGSKIKLGLFVGVALVVLAVAIYMIMNYSKNTYEGLVKEHYEALYNGDESAYYNTFMKEFSEKNKEALEHGYTSVQAELSGGIKYTYRIDSTDKIVGEQKELFAVEVGNNTGKEVKLSQLYEITMNITRDEGGKLTESVDTIWVIKVKGNWYIYTKIKE